MHNIITRIRIPSLAMVAAMALTACVGGVATNTSGVGLTGHPYQTTSKCTRVEPLGKFDAGCDQPVLGIKDFRAPTVF